jgi:asparagine synthase (glutamine-hydrolysing)
MTQFVALHWNALVETSPRIDWIRRTIMHDAQWTIARDEPGRLVAISSHHGLRVRQLGPDALVIGDLFTQDGHDVSANFVGGGATDAKALFLKLANFAWGRYVAIARGPGEALASVFRDPMGGLDSVVFEAAGVQAIASTLPNWLLIGLEPALSVDWGGVRRQLLDPTGLASQVSFRGVRAAVPGEMLGVDGVRTSIWRPADVVRGSEIGSAGLCQLVDGCVLALGRGRTVVAEVSGGIDSAIVAAALRGAEGVSVSQWLNYYIDDAEGDERAYARAVSVALDLLLTEVRKPNFQLSEALLAETAEGLRPGIWATDGAYDADMAARCSALNADAIFTGHGGDSVFFQMPTMLVGADHLHAKGAIAAFDGVVADVARWTRRSVWSVFLAAARPSKQRDGAGHPWLTDIGDLPPGKRLQLRQITSCLTFSGSTRRGRAAHLIHPLLSQPVVEHCLALSTVALTEGRRDRAYARRSFSDRLPEKVTWRWGKGDATAHFGRAIASHRPFLRTYLLDGLLAKHGLLKRDRLEQGLEEEQLIWRGGAGEILHILAVEAWVRRWDGQLKSG